MCLTSVIHVLVVSRQKSRQKHFSNENVSCSKLCYFTVTECQRSEQGPGGLLTAHSARDRKCEMPVKSMISPNTLNSLLFAWFPDVKYWYLFQTRSVCVMNNASKCSCLL